MKIPVAVREAEPANAVRISEQLPQADKHRPPFNCQRAAAVLSRTDRLVAVKHRRARAVAVVGDDHSQLRRRGDGDVA